MTWRDRFRELQSDFHKLRDNDVSLHLAVDDAGRDVYLLVESSDNRHDELPTYSQEKIQRLVERGGQLLEAAGISVDKSTPIVRWYRWIIMRQQHRVTDFRGTLTMRNFLPACELAIDAVLNSVQDSPTGPTIQTSGEPPTPQQERILVAMLRLGATDVDHRKKADDIATEFAKATAVNRDLVKDHISELGRRGYIETKKGRGGGSWLSMTGLTTAENKMGENGAKM